MIKPKQFFFQVKKNTFESLKVFTTASKCILNSLPKLFKITKCGNNFSVKTNTFGIKTILNLAQKTSNNFMISH